MSSNQIDILSVTSREFIELAATRGVREPQAIELYRRAFREGHCNADWIALHVAPISQGQAEGRTIKFTQKHSDGLETESVILPYTSTTGRRRNTLCVSSQIGCAMGCTFCETARMGLMKNLTAAQIVGQWWAATHLAISRSSDLVIESDAGSSQPITKSPNHQIAKCGIDNIVFMGMGEPMDNLDSVIQAIAVLTDRNGASIAPAHVSVSTVGRIEGIERLANMARQPGFHKLRLAVSINAPNDEIRSRLMPINRSTPMPKLMQAMLNWPTEGRQRVLIEYVLIPGVNDDLQHAVELCDYLRPLKCTVNVIPYNPRRDSPWPAPAEEDVRRFVQAIHEQGQFVKRRQTLGRSVMAACGQLGNPTIRGRKLVQAV